MSPAPALKRFSHALFSLVMMLTSSVAANASDETIEQAILASVQGFADAWNRGDMDGYLNHYRQDGALSIYMSAGQLIGAEEIRRVYQASYPTPEKMGNFSTADVTVRLVSPELALARGNFEHRFTDKTVRGNFSLVWQKFADQGWKIIHEHTARKQVLMVEVPAQNGAADS